MKKPIQYIMFIICLAFVAASCSDWTDVEANKIDTPGKSDQYYADLRAWKENPGDRGVTFGWFGGWTGVGASLSSSLIGLPDSMDMVSIWGDWKNINEARRIDLERAQKIKGLKVMACSFTENVGDGLTPSDQTVLQYWGWDPKESGLHDEPTENQKKAIRKYATEMANLIISLGYDGFDIDHEPNYGGSGDLASSRPRLKVFIEELSKYFGPKSGSGRFLAVDGEPQSMPKEVGPCFDWFIVQAYDCKSYTNLNSRLSNTINNYSGVLSPAEVAKKYIVTENFEKAEYNTSGGANFSQEDGTIVKSFAGMAGWKPLYQSERLVKGGAGVYHIEYEYTAPGKSGFYPFTREAIRIMTTLDEQSKQ